MTRADDEKLQDRGGAEADVLMPDAETKPLRKRKIDPIRAWLLRALFAGAVLMLLLVAFAAKFDSLQTEVTIEQANAARSLAGGQGLSSPSVQPLSFALAPEHPDLVLYTAPAYPVILAGAMRVLGESDRIIGLVALIFLMLTIVLTYLVARRMFDERTAVGAVAVMVLTVPLLQHVVSGSETAFLGLLVTGLFALLLLWTRSEHQESDWWPVGASALIIVAWLTRYEMAMLLPTVIVFWLYAGRRQRRRRLLWTIIPFVVVAGLWGLYNSRVTGHPMVSPWGYHMLADTTLYPNTVIARTYEAITTHPWVTLVQHPGMMAMKFTRYLRQLYYAIPNLGNPIVAMFFLVGAVIATARRELTLQHWAIVLAMGLTVAALCLYLPNAGVLVPFIPVVSLLAVRKLVEILDGMVQPRARLEWDGGVRVTQRLRTWLGIAGPHQGTERLVAFALIMLILVASYPTVDYLFLQPPAERTPLIGAAQAMGRLGYDLVVSNVPQALAWYGEVPTMGLPTSPIQLRAMENAGIEPDAIYLIPSPAAMQMEFEGYERVERPGVVGLLWERVDR